MSITRLTVAQIKELDEKGVAEKLNELEQAMLQIIDKHKIPQYGKPTNEMDVKAVLADNKLFDTYRNQVNEIFEHNKLANTVPTNKTYITKTTRRDELSNTWHRWFTATNDVIENNTIMGLNKQFNNLRDLREGVADVKDDVNVGRPTTDASSLNRLMSDLQRELKQCIFINEQLVKITPSDQKEEKVKKDLLQKLPAKKTEFEALIKEVERISEQLKIKEAEKEREKAEQKKAEEKKAGTELKDAATTIESKCDAILKALSEYKPKTGMLARGDSQKQLIEDLKVNVTNLKQTYLGTSSDEVKDSLAAIKTIAESFEYSASALGRFGLSKKVERPIYDVIRSDFVDLSIAVDKMAQYNGFPEKPQNR